MSENRNIRSEITKPFALAAASIALIGGAATANANNNLPAHKEDIAAFEQGAFTDIESGQLQSELTTTQQAVNGKIQRTVNNTAVKLLETGPAKPSLITSYSYIGTWAGNKYISTTINFGDPTEGGYSFSFSAPERADGTPNTSKVRIMSVQTYGSTLGLVRQGDTNSWSVQQIVEVPGELPENREAYVVPNYRGAAAFNLKRANSVITQFNSVVNRALNGREAEMMTPAFELKPRLKPKTATKLGGAALSIAKHENAASSRLTQAEKKIDLRFQSFASDLAEKALEIGPAKPYSINSASYPGSKGTELVNTTVNYGNPGPYGHRGYSISVYAPKLKNSDGQDLKKVKIVTVRAGWTTVGIMKDPLTKAWSVRGDYFDLRGQGQKTIMAAVRPDSAYETQVNSANFATLKRHMYSIVNHATNAKKLRVYTPPIAPIASSTLAD